MRWAQRISAFIRLASMNGGDRTPCKMRLFRAPQWFAAHSGEVNVPRRQHRNVKVSNIRLRAQPRRPQNYFKLAANEKRKVFINARIYPGPNSSDYQCLPAVTSSHDSISWRRQLLAYPSFSPGRPRTKIHNSVWDWIGGHDLCSSNTLPPLLNEHLPFPGTLRFYFYI
jgi:hypothetical protein